MEPSWHKDQRVANWIHPDSSALDWKSRPSRKEITDGYYSANENRFVRPKTSSMANDREVPKIQMSKLTGRTHSSFYIPASEPLPREGKNVTHGGVYYETNTSLYKRNSNLPFTRKVTNRKEMIEKIEAVIKAEKRPRSQCMQRRK